MRILLFKINALKERRLKRKFTDKKSKVTLFTREKMKKTKNSTRKPVDGFKSEKPLNHYQLLTTTTEL